MAGLSENISGEVFLERVNEGSGLLFRNGNRFSFAHQTFQEYLAAKFIQRKGSVEWLIKRIKDEWWHETIRLYCASNDATPIIEASLADNNLSVSTLLLAFDCQKDTQRLQPEVKDRLDKILIQGIEDADPKQQHIAVEVLLARRLRQMVYIKQNTFIDTSLITCAEYQLFLDEQTMQGKYYHPDHWKTYHFLARQALRPILGIRPLDATAFCAWLTERETDSWRYRLLRKDEFESHSTAIQASTSIEENNAYWLDQYEFIPTKGTFRIGLSKKIEDSVSYRIKQDIEQEIKQDRKEALNFFSQDIRLHSREPNFHVLDITRCLNNATTLDRDRIHDVGVVPKRDNTVINSFNPDERLKNRAKSCKSTA